MMQEYSHFHPKIMNMISMASHLKRWPLYIHEPISTWVREGIVLIGDAVHPVGTSLTYHVLKAILANKN